MPDERPHRSLESLKKEAKRWLATLRAGDPDARARLERSTPNAAAEPTLRDVQLALAREHGFAGWAELKHAAGGSASHRAQARYDDAVDALLEAYRTGTPQAMERHYAHTWHRRAWDAMRRYVQADLGKRPAVPGGDVDITVDDARYLVAIDHGFTSWDQLTRETRAMRPGRTMLAKPMEVRDPSAREAETPLLASRDWGAILDLLASHPATRLDAHGQMTDAMLEQLARAANLTALVLGGSQGVTDDGLRHLARLAGLTHLDLSGTRLTDDAMAVLCDLPRLESLSLAGTRVTDAGASHLSHLPALRELDVSWTRSGDGVLRALAGRTALRVLRTGQLVTNDGLAFLHGIPAFREWQGGESQMALLSYDAAPNQLVLRGTFTDEGMARLRGLDGLYALNVDDAKLALSAQAMIPLLDLPHLEHLAADAKDDWMPHIAALPRLRFLGAQDTTAGDDGFAALSRSRTLEYIWGRRCHNLRRRGFVALSRMPALRGLSVSCLNVDDAGIATLPDFPALRELMPMDVPDEGYRHIGRCERLESLVLMYCRDTTDAATEHVTGLARLTHYFNSYTTITDRTPELLSGMSSLEEIIFDACHGLTDAGVARLARLPRLRLLRVSGRRLTPQVAGAFPAHVRVRWAP